MTHLETLSTSTLRSRCRRGTRAAFPVLLAALLAGVAALAGCGGADAGGADAGGGSVRAGGDEAAGELPDQIPPAELDEALAREPKPLLLDVRTPAEYQRGHVAGSYNVPVQELERRVSEVEERAEGGVIVYCESGARTRKARSFLEKRGLDTAALQGEMVRWRNEGRPVERGR